MSIYHHDLNPLVSKQYRVAFFMNPEQRKAAKILTEKMISFYDKKSKAKLFKRKNSTFDTELIIIRKINTISNNESEDLTKNYLKYFEIVSFVNVLWRIYPDLPETEASHIDDLSLYKMFMNILLSIEASHNEN